VQQRAVGERHVAGGAREAKRVIVAQGARLQPDPVAHAVTVDDLLPGAPDEQRRKLELLDEIRRLLAPARLERVASPERRARLASLRPPDGLRPLGVDDLPELARLPFTERDGAVGRNVLVYPPLAGYSSWNGHDLMRLARATSDVPLPDGTLLHASGRAAVFAAMLAAIARDGPLATATSLGAVAALTALLLRRRGGAVAVVAALALGVLWMLGVAAALDVKLNFLNFIALPITFGIGVDYAANVLLRWRQGGSGAMGTVLRSTGGAVILNSATTVIGYGSLLVAHNRALRSFGSLAILGELATLAVAVVLVPAVVELRARRRAAPLPEGRLPAP
jgi:hypothetical protein